MIMYSNADLKRQIAFNATLLGVTCAKLSACIINELCQGLPYGSPLTFFGSFQQTQAFVFDSFLMKSDPLRYQC